MMCRKCGVSIPAGADKCPNCGAPAPHRRPERRNVSRAANPKMAARIPFLLAGLVLLHVAEIVFWFLPAIHMDTSGQLSGSLSLFKIFWVISSRSGYSVFNLFSVAVLLAAAVSVYLAAAPLFKGGQGRRMRMITSKVTVLCHAAILGGLFGIYRSVGRDGGFPTTLMPCGYVQFVLCLAIFALTAVISFSSKQRKVDRL